MPRLTPGHVALALVALVACDRPPAFDLIIEGGRVVDGMGSPAIVADVGVRNGLITAVGDLADAGATNRVDAQGMIVAPGFIDPHVHAREGIVERPGADNFVRQGVTTLVDGNDGSSPLPLAPYIDSLRRIPIAPNLALFVGHGSVRRAVMGTEDRPATTPELRQMEDLVRNAMRDGALGLSTGLFYVPGSYAPTEEIVALARVAADSGGIYTSHMRNEDDRVVASVEETIRIAREAHIPVHISHHKVGGQRNFGRSAETLARIEAARRDSLDVTFDQYPYTASHTSIASIVPAWARANDGLADRLNVAATRQRIYAEIEAFVDMRFGNDPSRIQLARCGFDSTLAGRTVADVVTARGATPSPRAIADAILDLVARGGCSAIFHSFDEGDIERLMQSPWGMIGSDGGLPEFGRDSPHPRAYGTYPRVLGRYVRERRVIALEEAIRRMTSAPAARLGFRDRGRIAVNMVADLVVFDPATVNDQATFEAPHAWPVGIPHVFVSGVAVVRDGAMTSARPGRFIPRVR